MKVITYNGKIAERKDCKRIKGKFYIKNKQCFLMSDNKWHRINNGKITKDYETNKYAFISDDLINGIVGVEKNGEMKYGNFTKNNARNVSIVINNKNITCLNKDILYNFSGKVQCIGDGKIYIDPEKKQIESLKRKSIYKGYDEGRLEYRCDSKLEKTTKVFNETFRGDKFKHKFHEKLPPVSFGVEYESNNGRIREDLMMQNGLIPVRDGSLRNEDGSQPYEYATIILKGELGLKAIVKQCKLLNKYCNQSHRNSLHVHIGGIQLSKEYVVSVYRLGLAIQDELYLMFPKEMKDTSSFKQRSYCNPIKNFRFTDSLDENFNKIYKYLAMNENSEFEGWNAKHPKDPNNNTKWNVETR